MASVLRFVFRAGLLLAVVGFHMNSGQEILVDGVDCSIGQHLQPNPYNCGQYYQCSHGRPLLRSCPYGLYFNPAYQICDWEYNVDPTGCSNIRENPLVYNSSYPIIKFIKVVGPLSGDKDKSPSTVECPEGTVPIECACSIPSLCDGSVISSRKCTVINAAEGSRQQAIATCLTELRTREFVYIQSGDYERNPTAECPGGYQIFGCNLLNSRSQEGYVHRKIFLELNACASDGNCTNGAGCSVQAICRLDYDP